MKKTVIYVSNWNWRKIKQNVRRKVYWNIWTNIWRKERVWTRYWRFKRTRNKSWSGLFKYKTWLEGVVMESVQPKYVPISTLAKIWGQQNVYLQKSRRDQRWRKVQWNMYATRLQHTLVHVDKFETWMKSQNMKWLKGA